VSARAYKDGRTFSSQVTCGATGALTIYFIVKQQTFTFECRNRIIISATNQQHHFLFTNPTEGKKS